MEKLIAIFISLIVSVVCGFLVRINGEHIDKLESKIEKLKGERK